MNDLTPTDTQNALPADPMMDTIAQFVSNPDVSVEKLTALMDMRERQLNKEAEQAFNEAFANAMAEMPNVPRTGQNNHTKQRYSTLDDLIKATRPVLSRHGLSLNWQTQIDGDNIHVTAVVRHAKGHTIMTTLTGRRDTGKQMNHLQGGGSAETYLKRYSGFSILGLSSGDEVENDGQGQQNTITAEQYRQLRQKLEDSGISEVKFNQAFGHPDPENADLHEFPTDKFQAAMTRLGNYAAAKGKANADA